MLTAHILNRFLMFSSTRKCFLLEFVLEFFLLRSTSFIGPFTEDHVLASYCLLWLIHVIE